MMVLRQAGLIMVTFHCIIRYLDHGACDWLGLKPHICSRTAQQVEGDASDQDNNSARIIRYPYLAIN